jgi:hypothetical protein
MLDGAAFDRHRRGGERRLAVFSTMIAELAFAVLAPAATAAAAAAAAAAIAAFAIITFAVAAIVGAFLAAWGASPIGSSSRSPRSSCGPLC